MSQARRYLEQTPQENRGGRLLPAKHHRFSVQLERVARAEHLLASRWSRGELGVVTGDTRVDAMISAGGHCQSATRLIHDDLLR